MDSKQPAAIACISPLFDLKSEDQSLVVVRGATSTSYVPQTANTFSASQISFNALPPSANVVIDREIYVQASFYVRILTAAAVPGVRPVQLGLNDALRSYPLASVTQTANLELNGTTMSIALSDMIQPMMAYGVSKELRESKLSMSPSASDTMQQYGDYVTYGSARNVLSMYGESIDGVSGRGGFPGVQLLATGAATPFGVVPANNNAVNTQAAYFLVTVTEPLFVPPAAFGSKKEAGLYGITNMQVTLALGDLSRLWSRVAAAAHPAGAGVVSVLPAEISTARLLIKYCTPGDLFPIPKRVMTPYLEMRAYPQNLAAIAAGGSFRITCPNIQLNCVPHRLLIWATETLKLPTTTDTYAAIDAVSIAFDNVSGMLSTASPQDLYKICVDNHYNKSWSQHSFYTGSVLALDFGQDLGLPSTLAPGVIGSYQLQVTAAIRNPDPLNAKTYTVFCLPIMAGRMITENGRTVTQIGMLSSSDVVQAVRSPHLRYEAVRHLYGGSWWSKLTDPFVSAGRWVKGAANYVKERAPAILDVGQKILDVAKHVPVIGNVAGLASDGLAAGRELTGLGGIGGRRPQMKGRSRPMSSDEMRRLLARR